MHPSICIFDLLCQMTDNKTIEVELSRNYIHILFIFNSRDILRKRGAESMQFSKKVLPFPPILNFIQTLIIPPVIKS